MRRIATTLTALTLGTALAATPALAWVEAESENFVLRGDLRSGDAKDLLRDLEGYRANFLRMVGSTGGPERLKVRIYTVPDDAELEALTGRTSVGGLYRTDMDGPVFLLNTESGFRRGRGRQRVGSNLRRGAEREGNSARRTAFHEYAHHLMAAYTDAHYPRWYNGGFAEFLASYEDSKKGLSIGHGTRGQALWLEHGNWIPIETMLRAVHDYPFREGTSAQGAFYAQSWLMVHYLQNTPGLSAKSNAYFAALNRGEDPIESFPTAFGQSPAAFETDLKRYFEAGRINISKIDSPVRAKGMEIEVRDASEREGALWMAEAAAELGGRGDAGRERRRRYLDAAEAALGRTPELILLEVEAARVAGDHARALELAREAHTLAPERLDTLRELGRSEVLGWRESSLGGAEAGRATLRRALAISPDDPVANYHLALSYADAGAGAPSEAVMAAGAAINYYRDLSYAPGNLRLAPMLIANGEGEFVRPLLASVAAWAESPSARRYARELMARLG